MPSFGGCAAHWRRAVVAPLARGRRTRPPRRSRPRRSHRAPRRPAGTAPAAPASSRRRRRPARERPRARRASRGPARSGPGRRGRSARAPPPARAPAPAQVQRSSLVGLRLGLARIASSGGVVEAAPALRPRAWPAAPSGLTRPAPLESGSGSARCQLRPSASSSAAAPRRSAARHVRVRQRPAALVEQRLEHRAQVLAALRAQLVREPLDRRGAAPRDLLRRTSYTRARASSGTRLRSERASSSLSLGSRRSRAPASCSGGITRRRLAY